jgi:hypothetical protein
MTYRLVIFLGVLLAVLSVAPGRAFAETRWASTPADGARWSDRTGGGTVHLVVGDEVELLAQKGALVRVRKGSDFGWVAQTALTTVAPSVVIPAPADGTPPEMPTSP